MTRIYLVCICLLLLGGPSALTLSGQTSEGLQEPQQGEKKDTEDPKLLSMEIRALETLRNFKATVPQLQKIAQLAKATKAKAEQAEPARVGADYVNALKNLRVALIANKEDEIEKNQQQLEKLAEKNPPELDDWFDITDAARREVEGLYKLLSARQVVIYADSFGDDLPDPVELIAKGCEELQMLKGKEWEEARDYLADEVSWLVIGLDRLKAAKLKSDVSAFLERQHGNSSPANELEPKIRQMLGTLDPIVLVRNLLKHDLALLLSNPQLDKAVQELLNK
jgi:hypothetical protein